MPQLDSSAFWGIAGIIIGIIVATFFFIMGKRKTLLQYQKSSTTLIPEKMAKNSKINISVNGKQINGLISTTIQFTNVGNQPVRSSDFALQKPLHINIAGSYYGHEVSAGNQDLIPLLDKNNMNINFEGLQPKQYFSVTILHEGTIDVSGTLLTGKMREYKSHFMLSIIFIGICACLAGFLMSAATSGAFGTLYGSIIAIASFILLCIVGFIFKHQTRDMTLYEND